MSDSSASGPRRRRSAPDVPGTRWRRLVAVAVTATVAACGGEQVVGVLVDGLTEIDPAPEWRRIYGEVEACTGVEGDFGRVTWYRAASIQDTLENDEPAGYWLGPNGHPHSIAIHRNRLSAGGRKLEATVRHESIHEVLQLRSHSGQIWCDCDGRAGLFEQCPGGTATVVAQ